jgi:peptidoglycan/xylan/chitin deacetylase (PgdA/CDA1 family)/sulfur carrier protein ThiS
MAGGVTWIRGARAAALAVVLVACTAESITISPSPPPVAITVDGAHREVPPGTTLAMLLRDRSLRPTPGRLLAVDGSVLEHRAYPGRVLVNGRPAPERTELSSGDRVSIVDGRDRTEPTQRRVRMIGPRVGNPERTLRVYRTRQVTVVGSKSGLVASRTEVSLGPGVAPRAVALTFDDGPWPGTTARLLRVLHRLHVPATFFMVGTQAARYPHLVRRVRRAGDEIGNHSFDHPTTLAHLSADEVAREMRRATDVLATDQVRPTLFRPPGGWYDDDLVQQARLQDMRIVTWDVDPRDWRSNVSPREVAHAVLSKVHAGSIVLLHDGGGDAAHTIRALPRIVRGIRARGLRLVTIPAHPV